jgi:dihydroorotase
VAHAIDVVLRGGTVVTPEGRLTADIEIDGGRIVGLSAGDLPVAARDVIDVSGLTLLPGLIDTHTHLREPGHAHKEDIAHATRAAAAGGYTTVIGMPNTDPVTSTVERYRDAIAGYERSAYVDFNHFPSGAVLEELDGLAAAGAPGFKIYMVTGADLRQTGRGVGDSGHLFEAAEGIARTGLPMLVHPQDTSLMGVLERRHWARGERDHIAYAKAYAAFEGLVWDAPSALLVRLQAATGVHLHLLHLKTRRMAEIVRAAKAAGQRVTAEVNPVSLLLANDWATIKRLGPYVLSSYIGDGQSEPLWEAFRDGTIDVIGTDHAPHTRAEKEVGWTDMWKSAGGLPHLQETLPAFLTRVAAGDLTLERLVEAGSAAPARLLGVYPRKGAILPGSDADIVAVDLAARTTFREEDVLSKCGWSAFTGSEFVGLPSMTLVRGRVVYRDGAVTGQPGWGRVVQQEPR